MEKDDFLSKTKRIQAEIDRITAILSPIDGNQLATLEPLIQNAAFMRITCEDLQRTIIETGAVEVYQNGEHQHGLKQSAALQSYNSVIKNLTTVIRAISGYVPPEKRSQLMTTATAIQRQKTDEEIRRDQEAAEERERKRNEEIDFAIRVQKMQRSLESQSGRSVDWYRVRDWMNAGMDEEEMLQLLSQ